MKLYDFVEFFFLGGEEVHAEHFDLVVKISFWAKIV